MLPHSSFVFRSLFQSLNINHCVFSKQTLAQSLLSARCRATFDWYSQGGFFSWLRCDLTTHHPSPDSQLSQLSFTYTLFWNMHAHIHRCMCLRPTRTHTQSNATVVTGFCSRLFPWLNFPGGSLNFSDICTHLTCMVFHTFISIS